MADVRYILFFVLLKINGSWEKKKSADNYMDLCYQEDPNLNSCIKNSIKAAISLFATGIPDLNLPPMDPLYISTLRMVEGSENLKMSLILSNGTVTNLRTESVEKFSIDLKNESQIIMDMEGKAPWLSYTGQYDMDGKILFVPVKGNGDFFMNITDVYVQGKLHAKTYINPKDGNKYLNVNKFECKVAIKGGECFFDHLFNGDKRLGKSINRFFNENIMQIFRAVKHLPEQAIGAMMKDFANIIFSSFTFDELFLPGLKPEMKI